jgi:hypothetical protein
VNIDPNNPVVKLCAEGIGIELAGKAVEAAALYRRAWEARTNEFEACIAAHYLARVQRTPQETLRWNEAALRHAERADPSRITDFYPSLYLNLGKSHEDTGNREEARRFYALAAAGAVDLP